MSEFEYTSSSNEETSDEEEFIIPSKSQPKTHYSKVAREMGCHYSNLFIDSFNLIDLFVKSKSLTYSSFLEHFSSMKFHEIYVNGRNKNKTVTPHHYITTAQDSLAVATKFLRSKLREARIGAVYLLFTMNRTQPFKHYLINIKMVSKDYSDTKELVDSCLKEGLVDPAYCFYQLDLNKKITISATAINPCLEANYPRAEVRKHMGRVADKCFKTQYEERKNFDPSNRLQMMESQILGELATINKMSNMCLGRDAASEYKPELSRMILKINSTKNVTTVDQKNNDIDCPKKPHIKNSKTEVFPGRNEEVLDDQFEVSEPSILDKHVNNCHPKKKLKLSKTQIDKHNTEEEPMDTSSSLQSLSTIVESDSSSSSISSDDDDYCGKMILRYLEGQENNEVIDHSTTDQEDGIKI